MHSMDMIWTDNFYVDESGREGWFVGGEISALFHIDFIKNQYKYVNKIGDISLNEIRRNTLCTVYNKKVFCFPVCGDTLWIYNLVTHKFSYIKDSIFGEKMCVPRIYIYNDRIYMFSKLNNGLIIINPETEAIERIVPVISEEISIPFLGMLFDGDILYCSAIDKGKIFAFSLKTEKVLEYEIPQIPAGISTITKFKGDSFLLTGYKKELYLWNKSTGEIKIISGFPEGFGIYEMQQGNLVINDHDIYPELLFSSSIDLGRRVLLIPYRTNKLLCFDKENMKLDEIAIPDEEEDRDILSRPLPHKYLTVYIRQNKFLGLYSLKNNCLIEIDADNLKVEQRHIYLSDDSWPHIMQELKEEGVILDEKIYWHKKCFMNVICPAGKEL